MRSFITALQFLTRIHLVKQEDLTAEDFGRSTRFFPLVGAVLGCLYLLAARLKARVDIRSIFMRHVVVPAAMAGEES